MFQDLSSSPAAMEASKAADLYGILEGHKCEQADAEQAYTQSVLGGIKTWVRLPREQWPQAWIDAGYHDPVCPLILSLYGHPDAGGYWEKHCEKHLFSKGWTKIPDWRSCFWHPEHKCFLMVYVDDFKMSGPEANLKKAWDDIRWDIASNPTGIKMDPPSPSGKFLGCDHIVEWRVSPITGNLVKTQQWAYEHFMRDCVELYCKLTGQSRTELKPVATPFLDEGALRAKYGVGPANFPDPKQPKKKPDDVSHLATKDDETENDDGNQLKAGTLRPIAARVLMKTLHGARYARQDLLRSINALARKITKWTVLEDCKLHRLMQYLNCTLHYREVAWVGDAIDKLELHLFADADLASDPEDHVSTSGVHLEISGPDTKFPLQDQSKKQTAVSHSTPEAEIVAIDHALRTVGLPALQLWDVLLQRPTKLQLHEDNAACIRVMETGRNPTMRHLGRTHRIDVAWTAERIQGPDVELIKTDTKIMAADIHTKPFPDALRSDWERDLRLINIVDPDKFFVAPKPETASVSKAYDDDEKLAGGCADAASAADTNDADLDELSDDDDTDEDWEVTPLSKDDMEFDCPEWSPCQSSDYDYGVLYACPAYPRDTAPVAEDTLFAIPGIPKACNRVLFEFCADPDSMLGQLKSKSRNGCVVIRATEYHDMSSQKGIEWALKVIDSIPKHCKIMLWSAIPCTGG